MKCPSCQSELLPKAKFCRKCGTPVKKADSTELMTASGLGQDDRNTLRNTMTISCPKCGAQHDSKERFCVQCNHDFSPRTTLIAPPPNNPAPIITGERISQPTLPQTEGVIQQATAPVRKRRSPVVPILLALLALLGVGGTIGHFYLQNQKALEVGLSAPSQNPSSSATQPPQTQTSDTVAIKPPESKTKPVEDQPSKTDVTGRWLSADNDIFDLKQNGTVVTGTYKGGKVFQGMVGTFRGTFDGKNFVGTYLHHIGSYQIRGTFRVAMTDGGQLVGTWIASDGNSGAYVLTRAKS